MSRPTLEVADIFRDRGPAWRRANAGHVSLEQLKVMSAIENCRTAALGGHVARCEECAFTIAADPGHLGARVGITSVLHTWGSALTHHPHVHMIVPGGGISLDGERWMACRPGLPHGFHRIRHYGLLASGTRADNIARARELLAVSNSQAEPPVATVDPGKPAFPCCGGRMIIIEVLARGATPPHQPTPPPIVIRVDTS